MRWRDAHESGRQRWRRVHENDIRDELADHLERRTRALIRDGMSEAEARADALRRLGDLDRIEEACMRIAERRRLRQRIVQSIQGFLSDLRHVVRGARRRPSIPLAVVLTIGLAIGAATSVFSVVNGVLLRPLPYPDDDRLYTVYTRYLPATGYDFEFFSISGPELVDYRAMTEQMTGVAGLMFARANLSMEGAEPERVPVVLASTDFFDVLGVQPVLGRGFSESDGVSGAECVAVLSDGMWRDRFAGDRGMVGRDIRYDGRPCRVVGVAPPDFVFPDESFRVFVAMALDPTEPFWDRESHSFGAIARLAPGATFATANAELDVLRARWSAEYPDHYALGHFMVLQSLREDIVGTARGALLVLLGAVGLMLLLVCANLGGLLLAGAESRRREFAVRAAIGESRARLIRQLLTESVLLGLVGGVLGTGVSTVMLRGVLALYPGRLPAAGGVGVDLRVLGFGLAVSIVCGILFGLAPAFQSSRAGSAESLRAVGRGLTSGVGAMRLRRAFVVVQTSLALLLAVGAVLLTRSYERMRKVDLGFDPSNTLTFSIAAPAASYRDAGQARAFFERLTDRLATLPGVRAAAAFSALPLESAGGRDDFRIIGQPEPAPGEPAPNAGYQMATPGTLDALGLRLVAGRWIDESDIPGRQSVAVVNETTQRRYFAEGAIGRHIAYFDGEGIDIEIVGVVADVRANGVRTEAPAAVYAALDQAPRPAYSGRALSFAVRFERNPLAAVGAVRATVSELDPALPISRLRTLEAVFAESLGQPRFTATLMGIFAVMALLVGALGVYAVLAHTVNLRRAEIGIRLTLGARRASVLAMIVRQGLSLTATGLATGLVGAILFRRVVAGLVFGVGAFDPASLIAATLALALVSLLACALPAWRAARVDPATAMHAQQG